ncbi:hypothetical protein Tco_1427101, partial [Tanacetum coccineum]
SAAMIVDDILPPPPTSENLIYLRGSLGFELHIDSEVSVESSTTTNTNASNTEWCKKDDLVKMWIHGTMTETFQDQVVFTPGNANNYENISKSVFMITRMYGLSPLIMELRSTNIGNLSINDYCTKLKAMTDRLKSKCTTGY